MQLLFRERTRNITVQEYQDRVISANRRLKSAAVDRPWLTYWKHKGLKNCSVSPLSSDLVHLNDFGMHFGCFKINLHSVYCCGQSLISSCKYHSFKNKLINRKLE